MKTKALGLLLSVLAVGALASCGGEIPDPGAAAPSLIATAAPSRRAFSTRLPWTGTARARESVRLVALVAGRVEKVAVEDGAPVEPGVAIFTLGGPRVEAERRRLDAEVESLGAQRTALEENARRLEAVANDEMAMGKRLAEIVEARRELAAGIAARAGKSVAETLATKDEGAAARDAELARKEQAERDRQETARRLRVAAADLAGARDALSRRRDSLRDAEAARDSFVAALVVSASRAGAFTDRRVSAGQEVLPGDVLGEVIRPSRLRIEAAIFAPEGAELTGRAATVRLPGGRSVSGRAVAVRPEAGPTGGRVVWIEGPEIDASLVPGRPVSGEIVLAENPSALAVPESAVVYDEEGHAFVFVPRNGDYDRVSVTVGRREDGWIEVLSGLDGAGAVVTNGAYELYYRSFSEQYRIED